MTDTPVIEQTAVVPKLTARDRLASLDTTEFTHLLRHDARRLIADSTSFMEMLESLPFDDAQLSEWEHSDSIHPRIRRAITDNKQSAPDIIRTERKRKVREDLEKDGIEFDEVAFDKVPFEVTPEKVASRFLPFVGESAVADMVETGDQTLALEMFKLGLAAPDTSLMMDEEGIRQAKHVIRESMRLLPVFADGIHFIKHPSNETLARLKAHKVNLKDLTEFFKGDIAFRGNEDFEVNGVEVIILANLINNAVDHGTTELHHRVIVDVVQFEDGHEIRVINYSKKPLTDEQLKPGVSSNVDENGHVKPGSGYGLAIVQTLTEAAGLHFYFNSEKAMVDDAYHIVTAVSTKPRSKIMLSIANDS